jgi:DNA primase
VCPRKTSCNRCLVRRMPTKEQLAAYWTKVWRKALKYLGRRPLKLARHVHGTTFYYRGPLPETPPAVHRLVQKREGGEGTRCGLMILKGYSAWSRRSGGTAPLELDRRRY